MSIATAGKIFISSLVVLAGLKAIHFTFSGNSCSNVFGINFFSTCTTNVPPQPPPAGNRNTVKSDSLPDEGDTRSSDELGFGVKINFEPHK